MMRGGPWNSLSTFFFKPISPYPIAVFRMVFGLCVSATLLLLHSEWLNWFGVHGWISLRTIDQAKTGLRLNLLNVFPDSDGWVKSLYWLFLVASITLTLGLKTRLSSVIVFLGLNSLNERMTLIFHGGDTFLRSVSFFMLFASSAAVLSIDNWVSSSQKSLANKMNCLIAPWPTRLIQCQLAIIYLASFLWKAKGHPWRDGTALYYVLNLREVRQFPISHVFYNLWVLRLGSWSVMIFELLFPLLVWFRRFRTKMLIIGVLFHLTLEYALNIPMFQWDMLSAYVLFLDFSFATTKNSHGVDRRSI
jgi:hypothetical protein